MPEGRPTGGQQPEGAPSYVPPPAILQVLQHQPAFVPHPGAGCAPRGSPRRHLRVGASPAGRRAEPSRAARLRRHRPRGAYSRALHGAAGGSSGAALANGAARRRSGR